MGVFAYEDCVDGEDMVLDRYTHPSSERTSYLLIPEEEGGGHIEGKHNDGYGRFERADKGGVIELIQYGKMLSEKYPEKDMGVKVTYYKNAKYEDFPLSGLANSQGIPPVEEVLKSLILDRSRPKDFYETCIPKSVKVHTRSSFDLFSSIEENIPLSVAEGNIIGIGKIEDPFSDYSDTTYDWKDEYEWGDFRERLQKDGPGEELLKFMKTENTKALKKGIKSISFLPGNNNVFIELLSPIKEEYSGRSISKIEGELLILGKDLSPEEGVSFENEHIFLQLKVDNFHFMHDIKSNLEEESVNSQIIKP